eukprot:TRINITY_DN72081_c0_g1_i1.p1 TRINITY_DN72081_c0_g1~~TRINITY_DN72081_c0_g1_i1.p1  ORF type:complete len:556 (-),score=161.52 TRINITY_DN72081_c0_g1_i1:224-1891(-)
MTVPPGTPAQQPSAAAAAGAAAAALLQRQLAQDGGMGAAPADPTDDGWTEHQTGDGRKFYVHQDTMTSRWEKPEVLMTPEERANQTNWTEYRIWDGRVFYHNKETKVSCWRMPPELRKMREGISGIDDRPLKLTLAEKRRKLLEAMKEKGVDATWTWEAADEAVADDPAAEELTEAQRKQCFAELISFSMRQRMIQERVKQRDAANALEKLIEEHFGAPEDVETTYEQATRQLQDEEAWKLIKSDVRRNEVFQQVMERLEEKHRKARSERRSERVVRLQRLMGSDPELKRARLRWKDAMATLQRRDELQDEEETFEALRVWGSLRDLKPAAEHEAENKARVRPDPEAYREDRKRRDAFLAFLKEAAESGRLTVESSWLELEAAYESNEPRLVAMRDARGATAMEILEEFQEDLRLGNIPGLNLALLQDPDHLGQIKREKDGDGLMQIKTELTQIKTEKEDDDDKKVGRPAKRQRFSDGDAPVPAPTPAARTEPAAEENVSALDAIIMGGAKPSNDAASENSDDSDDDEDDPLMGVVNAAAAAKRAAAAEAAAAGR